MSEFTLARITVRGFRGLTREQTFDFGSVLMLVYGGNRAGKSSLLNAVEWCLFGSEVAGIKYGDIRERDHWEVKNLQAPDCYVECQFQSKSTADKLRVRRRYVSDRKSDFWFELEGNRRSAKDSELHALLSISPSDFLRVVHLHPELIRTVIMAPPRDRKAAIDRLLGLSDLVDLAGSLQAVNPRAWTEGLDRDLDDLSGDLEVALGQKKSLIEQEALELRKVGF